ncbi:hypothetical protein ACNOYE_09840 [Nannocystaceae bacterium ST9]
MEPMTTRLIAGGALLAVLILGGWLSGGLTDEQAEQAKATLALEVPAQKAREQELAEPPSYTETPIYYRTELEATLAFLGLPDDVDATIARLEQPNVFFHPITRSAPVVLKAGETRTEQQLEITAVQEDLRVKRSGLESTSAHTLLRLHNVGSVPIAYWLVARSKDGGDCRMRAITQYDALVLGPDEQARISICSGSHAVEILDLRAMELTEIGARWIRQVPAQAFGLDEIAVRSHKPLKHVPPCSQVPVQDSAKRISAGPAQWEDMVDYYSRHDCNFYRWPEGYVRIVEPLTELPAKPNK